MKYLEDIVEIHGTGIPGLTAQLIERTDKKAMYLRSDGYYEVFKRKFVQATEAFGRTYEEHEVYPGNEDFGKIAWCIRSEDRAWARYNRI